MSEQQFLWNSLDGGENVLIKEGKSDKIIHIKIMEGKHEFVDFMKKVNEQQSIIRRDEMSIKTMMSNMKKLEEENEQLRQFINNGRRLSVKELIKNTNENELLKKKIRVLEKENENLESNIRFFSNQLKKLRGQESYE